MYCGREPAIDESGISLLGLSATCLVLNFHMFWYAPASVLHFLSQLAPQVCLLYVLALSSSNNQSTQNQCCFFCPFYFPTRYPLYLKRFPQNFKHDAIWGSQLLLCFVPCVFLLYCMELHALSLTSTDKTVNLIFI